MRKTLIWFIVVIILVAAAYFGWSSFQKEEGEQAQQQRRRPAPTVVTWEVQPQPVESTVLVNGSLDGAESIVLRSEASGRVVSVNFTEGSAVSAGDSLIVIDNSELLAELKALEARLRLAREIQARREALLARGLIPQEEFDEAANNEDVLLAQIQLVDARLAKHEIRAPFSGVIGLRHVSPGQLLSPADPIANLVVLNPLKLTFSVPEIYQFSMQEGMEVTLRVSGQDEEFTATVYAKDPRIDEASRTLRVRAQVENEEIRLLPGNFATVVVPLVREENAIMIPSTAITRDLDGPRVFVVEDGKAVEVKVQTGIRTEDRVQITEGLLPGAQVIYRGVQSVRNGQDVQVRQSSSATGESQ